MTYKHFEDLPVWKDSAELARLVSELTEHALFQRHYGLRDQLERAALSISNNIAEGFERGTNNELLAFLYVARGSAGEVRSMLRILELWDKFTELRPKVAELRTRTESISRQLHGWIEQLKRSGFTGQRHLNVVKPNKSTRSSGMPAKPHKER
ncbi:MAG: four helix bundle protein [Deltaproteobacteria bacterium]|nr:four helix bundle protein [Deltaproteobacteria bacterium]